MIPVGYMAKKISKNPDWLKSDHILDIYSVSHCISNDFADYIEYWQHNGYWFFDSPMIIEKLAKDNLIDLSEIKFFYYEVYELEFDGDKSKWSHFNPEPSVKTNVVIPKEKHLEGYDVVTFSQGNTPECSPLSCNSLSEEVQTNKHCLLNSFEEAKTYLENGTFNNSEPGPYRIFAVYSIEKS